MFSYTRRVVLAVASIAALATPALAQSYPAGKPIEMTVMFGAGSASDVTARQLAEGMAKVLGAPVPVVNRTGAGGAVGYTASLAAEARRLCHRVEFQLHLHQLSFRPAAVRLQEPRARRPRDDREPGNRGESQLRRGRRSRSWSTTPRPIPKRFASAIRVQPATPISRLLRCSMRRAPRSRRSRSARARPRSICWVIASRPRFSSRRPSSRTSRTAICACWACWAPSPIRLSPT